MMEELCLLWLTQEQTWSQDFNAEEPLPCNYRVDLQVASVLFLLEGCTDGIHSRRWDLSFRNYTLVMAAYKDKVFSSWNDGFVKAFTELSLHVLQISNQRGRLY